jgi:hypothetical protein
MKRKTYEWMLPPHGQPERRPAAVDGVDEDVLRQPLATFKTSKPGEWNL